MMTKEEYYAVLKVKHEKTDWNDIDSIREYNEFARTLRHMMYEWDDRRIPDVPPC